MAGSATAKGARGKGGSALDSVKTEQRLDAGRAAKDAGAKAAKASKPAKQGSGDSPKRQGDKLERARDAAAGKSKR